MQRDESSQQVHFLGTCNSLVTWITRRQRLLPFLASNVADFFTNNNLITKQGTGVQCSNHQDVSALTTRTHKRPTLMSFFTYLLLYIRTTSKC
jgi:hypothetical protein